MTRKTLPTLAGRMLLFAALTGVAMGPRLSAAEIRLPRHPDYHEGKIVFSYLGDLWVVHEDGSSPHRLTVHPARDVYPRFSPDGKKFAYNRHPMVWSRKHYRGSYAADLWVMDLPSKSSHKILDATLPDEQKPNNFWPMYGNGEIYFVSDRDVMAKAGSKEVLASKNNIWKVAEEGGQPVQVTHHASGSLFWPSMSSDSKTIVYEENFGLWKLDLTSGKSVEIKIELVSDDKDNNLETLSVDGDADSFHLSPSSKRAVISTHGELFSIATERGEIRRVTQTPGLRETQPEWSPDGKWIAFVGDQDGRDEVWICDEKGDSLKRVSDSDSQKSQIRWAPDSKALLYTASDKKLYKYDLATGK